MIKKLEAKEKIIIALDVPTRKEALSLISGLKEAHIFKVGMELFTAEGPRLLEEITREGKKVFLDLKYHDIPNTAAGAVRSAARHGVHMLTLHTSGGREMLARAVEAGAQEAAASGKPRPSLLGVTVLTSLKEAELKNIGVPASVADQVLRLALLAKEAGLDGVVCSPQEIEIIKKELGSDFLVVTPGIRPVWAAAQDQKRVMTPAEALTKGADYLVIGRPITGASSPQEAFLKIVREIERTYGPAD
jgi:orotidine-5'-phosphate decarboxylase